MTATTARPAKVTPPRSGVDPATPVAEIPVGTIVRTKGGSFYSLAEFTPKPKGMTCGFWWANPVSGKTRRRLSENDFNGYSYPSGLQVPPCVAIW